MGNLMKGGYLLILLTLGIENDILEQMLKYAGGIPICLK